MTRTPLALLLLLAGPALALPEGTFPAAAEGAEGTVTVEGDRFAIDVAAAGCVGMGSGTWTEAGGATVVTLDPPDPALAACTLTLTEADGLWRIEEGEGCLGHHGAACGFSGSFDPAAPAE